MSKVNDHIRILRTEYAQKELNESELEKDPILQFEKWMKEALDAAVYEPHAMTLATVNRENRPSSRIVLLRDFGSGGFIFYTNYHSLKGQDIQSNANASMLFFWPQIERQVRIDGKLEKVSESVSDAYFSQRPRESKIGAWVSEQSQTIDSRAVLEEKFIALSLKYPGEDIPRPSYWGGYTLKPSSMEFWQGRPSRLHDRIQFSLKNENWLIRRLSP